MFVVSGTSCSQEASCQHKPTDRVVLLNLIQLIEFKNVVSFCLTVSYVIRKQE